MPAREGGVVGYWCRISDEEGLPYVYDLLKDEGLCLGTSSAINIAGAVRLSRELGQGHTYDRDNPVRSRNEVPGKDVQCGVAQGEGIALSRMDG